MYCTIIYIPNVMEHAVYDFNTIVGFDWDDGNRLKNWVKHQVDYRECEEIFFNQPLVIGYDTNHSIYDSRFFALGRSDVGRTLALIFTVRNDKIRVFSARDQSKKERKIYEQQS